MIQYEGMKLSMQLVGQPYFIQHLAEEVKKVDKWARQASISLNSLERKNYPLARIIGGTSGNLGDHDHSGPGNGGNKLRGIVVCPYVLPSNVALIVRGLSGQTGNLIELQDSSQATLAYFTAGGLLNIGNSAASALVSLKCDAVSRVGVSVTAAASQTANLLTMQDSALSELAAFDANGFLDIGNYAITPTPLLAMKADSASRTILRVAAAASHTADLFRFDNSAGTAFLSLLPPLTSPTATPFRLRLNASGSGSQLQFAGQNNTGDNIVWDNGQIGVAPVGTTSEFGVTGARLYLFRDGNAEDDNAIGQSLIGSDYYTWNLVDPYSYWAIYTNDGTTAASKRVEWAPNGNMRNYGTVRISKFTVGATNPNGLSATNPALLLDGATSGTLTLQAAAATTSHSISLPAAAPASSGYYIRSTSTSATAWSTIQAGDLPSHDNSKHDDRTRYIYVPASILKQANGSPVLAFRGTYPDNVNCYALVDTPPTDPQALGISVTVPEDYVAASSITFKIEWFCETASASQNWVGVFKFLSVATSESVVGASNSLQGTVSANVTANQRQLSTIGTSSSGLAAGEMLRLNFQRSTSDGSDDFAQTVYVTGIRLEYTADM